MRTSDRKDEESEVLTESAKMAWDGTRRGDRTPKELITNVTVGSNETDAQWRDADVLGDVFHFPTYKIVGEKDAPQLLAYALWRLTAEGNMSLEHLGLEFIEGHLDFPSFVIERDQFVGGIADRVE